MLTVGVNYFFFTAMLNLLAFGGMLGLIIRQGCNHYARVEFLGMFASAVVWCFFFALNLKTEDPYTARLYFNLMTLGGQMALAFTFAFVSKFVGKDVPRWAHIANYGMALFCSALCAWTPYFVSGTHVLGPLTHYPTAGILHPLTLIHVSITLSYAFSWLVKEMRVTRGHRRQQCKWVGLGLFLGWLSGLSAYPGFYMFPWIPYLTAFLGVMTLCFGYAILKHKLMDVEVVIRKAAVFAGLFGSVILFLALFTQWFPTWVSSRFDLHLDPFWLNVFSCLFSFYGLQKIHGYLVEWTDRYLFQRPVNYSDLMTKLATLSFKENDIRRLLQRIVGDLASGLRLDSAQIYLTEKDGEPLACLASAGRALALLPPVSSDNPLFQQLLQQQQPISLEMVTSSKRLSDDVEKELKRRGNTLAIPLLREGSLMGYIGFGKRLSADPFNADDLDSLIPLSRMVSVFVANTLLNKELGRARERLEESSFDALTGVLVRGVTMERLQVEMVRAKHFSRDFALLMVDLDHFKSKNDTYGHMTGDRILAETASRLRGALRDQSFIGRYGGEEFIIFMGATTKSDAYLAAERLRKLVGGTPVDVGDKSLEQTCSIGVACFPEDGESIEQLIERADQCLYVAKRQGRNRVVVWEKLAAASKAA